MLTTTWNQSYDAVMLRSRCAPAVAQVRVIAQWLQKVDPQSDGAARDWVAIYDECSRILYQEIDYKLEGANADRFRWGLDPLKPYIFKEPVQL